jgi:low affinity Fe/Cu permease
MRWFDRITDATVKAAGSVSAVIGSVALVLVWAVLGPFFGFSENWQLVVNTATTIITFWLCFLVLHAQNRDTLALHAKLDELIKSSNARNSFVKLDKQSEQEIEAARE